MTGGADSKTSSAIIEKKRNSAQPEDISLYVHFPFCSRLCGYCDFHKEILNRHREKLYFEALKRETELAADEYYNSLSQSGNPSALTSLYIGGGTPSLADPRLFADWIGLLKRRFEITERTEFTVELNPESSHLENLELYKEFGVNRLSIGVQSFDTTALAALDRRHNTTDTLRVFYLARALGYEVFSADIIFGFPDQTLAVLESDLAQLIDLEPSHVSFYQLTVKENTPLAHQVAEESVSLPADDTLAVFYRAGCDYLARRGYERYEVSSFARDGKQSRHNIRYWSGRPYLALGPGASGFNGTDRYQVVSDTPEYIRRLLEDNERPLLWDRLNSRQRMTEDIMLSLRTTRGIDLHEFSVKHGAELKQACDAREYSRLMESGHLAPEGSFLRLSNDSLALADEIIARLIG